jgi:hypothetical protein
LEEFYFDIEAEISIDEVIKRLQQKTINEAKTLQTTYQQVFSGEITKTGARLTNFESDHRQRKVYELKFLSVNSKTIIRVSDYEFNKRQITSTLLKALLLPVGFIILILAFIYSDSEEIFIFALGASLLCILPPLFYNAKPLTAEQYKNDEYIQIIIKTLTK